MLLAKIKPKNEDISAKEIENQTLALVNIRLMLA